MADARESATSGVHWGASGPIGVASAVPAAQAQPPKGVAFSGVGAVWAYEVCLRLFLGCGAAIGGDRGVAAPGLVGGLTASFWGLCRAVKVLTAKDGVGVAGFGAALRLFLVGAVVDGPCCFFGWVTRRVALRGPFGALFVVRVAWGRPWRGSCWLPRFGRRSFWRVECCVAPVGVF